MVSRENVQRIHDAASRRKVAGYVDPNTGLMVMTAWHLQKRGHCCGAGCRHCPYSPEERKRARRPEDAETWEG